MEVLRLYIHILETNEAVCGDATVRMVLFDGYCEGAFFNGTILKGGVDTQIIGPGQRTSLSARYMLEGRDCRNEPCRLFVENNAESENGRIINTEPTIFTDSKDLKWLEREKLSGRIIEEEGKLVIIIEKG
ncbi:MAG: DUF3237 domain-containing protein [Lachnospiraceae bacterium]|nr:DUF3237 domain-containing protein [Lachnospiraceae bacterium]